MKTTLKTVSEKMYNSVSSKNYNPAQTVFRPVLGLGFGSNVEIVNEYYTTPNDAMNRAQELKSEGYILKSCGFNAQVHGYCSQKIDQDGEVPQSMSGIKYAL